MPRFAKTLSRALIAICVAGSVSGCTGWVERQMDTAERALDCAVIATARTPATAQMAHCDRHPAANG